jgi:hypothetical protein
MDIISRLQKLKALANSTHSYFEQELALKKFRTIMEKNGISEEDVVDDAVSVHQFKYNGKRESMLLVQVICKVLATPDFELYYIKRDGRKLPNTLGVDCTSGQKLEIEFLLDFYSELYRKEEQVFYEAFLYKHRIFDEKNSERKEVSDDYKIKLLKMMDGMDELTPTKRITDKSSGH